MTSTVPRFLTLCQSKGSSVTYKKDNSASECPCRTPEGYRDPFWHLDNPDAQMCNEAGFLPGIPVLVQVKAFVQPAVGIRASRMSDEQIARLFGEVQADDHIGIFPVRWQATYLDFGNFGSAGQDWIEYNGRRFLTVNTNLIPDPGDGSPEHHWELGLRLISSAVLV